MQRPARRAMFAATLAIAAALTACERTDSAQPDPEPAATADAAASDALTAQLAAVRAVTEPYQDVARAQADGWSMLVPRCRDNPPAGGMGWHYANPALIDDVVAVDQPEALVYEPQEDGTMSLVAVEYIIPYSARGADQTPPRLFDQDFLQNPADELWMLHVWLWRDNPHGMFATWHPDVSCQHAT